MKRLRFIYISAIVIALFAVPQALGASGDPTAFTANTPATGSDPASCPPPRVLGYDSTVYLCYVEEICFDVIAVDSYDDSLVITQVEGRGQFETLTDTSGQTCFMPDGVDSATYLFAYTVDRATDPYGDGAPAEDPLCPRDTILITVILNRPPYVSMADDFSISLCQAESLCFPAYADDPDFNIDSVWAEHGSYNDATDRFCFFADTPGVYTLILNAVDTCGAVASDTTIVTVGLNRPPTVDLGDDFSVYLCGERQVCIDAVVTDDNIETIYANFGNYDDQTGQVCFLTDTAGSYTIVLTAVDVCDVSASDTVIVTVVTAEPPYVDLGEDFSVALCKPSEVCVDVQTIEIYKSISTNLGVYDESAREVCFVPGTSGVYSLIVEVTDSCDLVAADTVNITVDLNSPPVVSGMSDTALYLCYPQEICLTVDVFDPDGDIDSTWANRGSYENGTVCFVPYDSGHYEIIVTAIDTCGNLAADTAIVFVQTDQGIALDCPGDTTIFTCAQVDTFCFPILIHGAHENMEIEVWGINTWYEPLTDSTGTVCFWSECANANHVTVHVTTPCNTYSCEFTVTVECNSPPLVILPPDTTVPLCETSDICLPVGISDPDNNLVDVIVPEGYYYDPVTSKVCFTPDTVGTYVYRVTAIDSCGAADWDEIAVEVVLNGPPVVDVGDDTTVVQCDLSEVCISFTVSDPDGNIVDTAVDINGSPGAIEGDQVCFTPDSAGLYCIRIIATDICDLSDAAEICVTVEAGDSVQIDCPVPLPIDIWLCGPGEVCQPLDIIGDSFQVEVSYGAWENGQLCFYADTTGYYGIEVIAIAECNADTCYIDFDVVISDEVYISCPADTAVIRCEPDTLCLPYEVSSNVDSVRVSPPAYIINDSTVCVPLLEAGDFTTTMIADGPCGSDTCTFTVTARFNRPPIVDAGDDTTLTVCDLSEICVPFTASDSDGNIVDITVEANGSPGLVNDGLACFTPQDFGTYDVVITAVDECDATGVDTVVVTVVQGDAAYIWCPEGIRYDTLCGPDTICVFMPIMPEDAEITISPSIGYYDPNTDTVYIGIDTGGTYEITIIAEAVCGSDTCMFTLEVEVAEPPVITCPELIDTILCLVEPVTLCYPVVLTGGVSQISVSPIGSYSAGQVCLPVDTAGTYQIMIAAEGLCGSDTCYTTINVEQDQPPQLFLPGYRTFERCPDDTDPVCIDGIYATDMESAVSLTMTCGVGDFQLITVDSGEVCFLPDSFGVYEFCFTAFDGCDSAVGSFLVEISRRDDCNVCLTLSIDGGECTLGGVIKDVALLIETNDPIGAFDILLKYDGSGMQFWDASIIGTQIDGWEYFTWNTNSPFQYHVHFIGIADMNNGAQHPPDSTLTPNGLLIRIEFLVTDNQLFGGSFIPINFVWYSCSDNTFSDPTGDYLYMDLRIYDAAGELRWDELDDENYPDSLRQPTQGAPDNCLEGTDKNEPIRCIEFINGGICIIHPESIDTRGDINLNGIAHEIADAVVFTNYFIYGFSAFRICVEGQIAATDVNADGLTLSVGDLVYLIRIIVGDFPETPKLTPYSEELVLSTDYGPAGVSITTEAVSTIGGALLVYDVSGDLVLGEPQLAPDAGGMDLAWTMENGELRMLIYNIGSGVISSGVNKLVEIACRGDGQLSPTRVEIVDYYGRPYLVAGKESALPKGFALNQNYPNPFNPATTISFTLPQATEWNLKIFNITGSLVREYQSSGEAGAVTVEWDGRTDNGLPAASGIYLYRLEAAGFSDSKKMVLLK